MIPKNNQLHNFVEKLKKIEPIKEIDPELHRDLYIELTIVLHGHLQTIEKKLQKQDSKK